MDRHQQYSGGDGHDGIGTYQQQQSMQTDGRFPEQDKKQATLYNFSPEELRVLRECSKEALLFRSIPLATVLASGAYIAMHKGYLARSPRYGVVPKVMGFSFLGYMLGKLSYQSTCAEKLMKLPDSKLANAIKKSKGFSSVSSDITGTDISNQEMSEVFTSIPQKPIFDDHKPDERDRNEGLDEYQRVTDSLSEYTIDPETSTLPPVSTYEDRRRANRDDYNSKFADRHRRPVLPETMAPPPSSGPSSYDAPPLPAGRKNKYGDMVYDEA